MNQVFTVVGLVLVGLVLTTQTASAWVSKPMILGHKGAHCTQGIVIVNGTKYWQWPDCDLDNDPNLTTNPPIASSGPGHCDKTGCEADIG
jgi:hypothetical protein